jgi:pimeloyl-ACP methyl ester carboxylesterase
VVFDSSLGIPGRDWIVIQSKIAELTRACYYDRVGLGRSDTYPKTPYTTQDMVDDLNKLLENANIAGPYVLVAHSMAGFNARLYASQYPQDVAGMVLVDVSHPDSGARWLALLPPESPDESSELEEIRQWYVKGVYDFFMEGPEYVDWETSGTQVRATGSLGDIPLVVLMQDPREWESDLPPELKEGGFGQLEIQMQKELAALSSNSTFIIVEDTGHFIHKRQPEAVLDAIRSVVMQVRGE